MDQLRFFVVVAFLLPTHCHSHASLLRSEGERANVLRVSQDEPAKLPLKNSDVTLDLMRSFKTTGQCGNQGEADLIRVGPVTDGGYVICEHAAMNSSFMVSIGIKGDDPISLGISEQFGVPAEQYDCFSGPSLCPANSTRCNVHFNHICAGPKSSKSSPVQPEQYTENSGGGMQGMQYASLQSMVSKGYDSALEGGSPSKYDVSGDNLVLKIDCEGCEWETLAAVPQETLKRFRLIIGELHWMEQQQNHSTYLNVMQKLLTDHRLVHTHGCNCFGLVQVEGTDFRMPQIVEFVAIRKDLSAPLSYAGNKYLKLDAPVCPENGYELKEDHWNLPPDREVKTSSGQ